MNPIKKQGGRRPGAGRKKKQWPKGCQPKTTTVQVEQHIINECRSKYGSLANALRIAATHFFNPKKT